MFIRRVKKQRSKDSKIFYQYTLAQSARIEGKVKQRSLLYLGSETLLADDDKRKIVLALLKSKIHNQPLLLSNDVSKELRNLADHYYKKYLIKYGDNSTDGASLPPAPDKAEFHNVDLKGIDVEDARTFGAEHLCKQVLDKLFLKDILKSIGLSDRECSKALISIAARAIFCASEHKTAQLLQSNSELRACFHYDQAISHKQLYAIADKLHDNKQAIDTQLYRRITNMFNITDKLVIFDISNTYFETRKSNSQIARHGRSKEKRSDCPIVVFTGVINEAGFIRHSRIYQGNTADVATLSDMLSDLEANSPLNKDKTIVIDAGIASEENLDLINKKGYKYVCVSRKRLKDYPVDPESVTVQQLTDRDKNKVELSIFNPRGYQDTWMYVQSDAKRRKEQSMNAKLYKYYEEDLTTIRASLAKKGGTKQLHKVWERIGRVKQKNSRVSAQYDITVEQNHGVAIAMSWKKKKNIAKEDKANGVYFIRTNYKQATEKQLWQVYNTIREVEATFRCLKTDLNIRPIHHQLDYRIESHIYLTTLAYQLINTIRHMLKAKGIKHDWQNIVRIMNTQKIQTLILPTDKKNIHLRMPSKPIDQAKAIYDATQCTHTQSATKKYVVYH